MEINLLPILNYEGKRINIFENVNISASQDDSFKINGPVSFDGYVVNIGGTIDLYGKATASLSIVCDRCTEEYNSALEYEIDERFKKDDGFSDSNEDSDITPLEGSVIDLGDILYTNLILNLPSKSLCSETCKGICPNCGKNLNHGPCDCDTDNTDPRFDILDKLL